MSQVLHVDDIAADAQGQRRLGRSLVLTNGCFDLLHVGHVRLLEACRAFGDVLIVGVNSDESVRQLKGEGRPFVPADERAALLAALRVVDAVTVFHERTAERLAALVSPDVYVKGADYASAGPGAASPQIDEARLPEARVVRRHGGRVVLVPLVPDRSSTALASRIRAAAGAS